MAGLDPAIHVFSKQRKTWMPQVSEATPFFERLWTSLGMTERE